MKICYHDPTKLRVCLYRSKDLTETGCTLKCICNPNNIEYKKETGWKNQ